jgi:arylsulfatase A-like enzyme/Flp pilus assembly protein TadD
MAMELMRSRGILVFSSVLLLSLGLLVLGCGKADDQAKKYNVLMIMMDTTRADRISCYGYEKIETHNIDEVARGGILFSNATSHAPLTLVSTASIMTSLLPPTHGVHYNDGFYLNSSTTTLAEILSEHGYNTAAVTGAVVLDSLTGIAQGFQYYDDNINSTFEVYIPELKTLQTTLNKTQRRGEEITNRGLTVLKSLRRKEEPFFLFLHYFDPHSPYDPPPPYNVTTPFAKQDFTRWVSEIYDGEIAYMDNHIGRLLLQMMEWGILDNTLIVITSDHGESLEEHNEATHGLFAYDATLQIPLIISLPQELPEGNVVQELVQHIDILPTILDILEIDHVGGFQGKSLLPLMVAEENMASSYAYFESATPHVAFGWSALRGIKSGEWKYINAPAEELYNLSTDPDEQDNILSSNPVMTDSTKKVFDSFIADLEIGEFSDEEEIDQESRQSLQELLNALGYIDMPRKYFSSYEEMFDKGLPDPKEMATDFKDWQAFSFNMRKGFALLHDNRFDDAILYFNESLNFSQGDSGPHFFLGLCYTRLKDYEKAEREFRKVISVVPENADPYRALSRVLMFQGDIEGALENVMVAISIDSTNADLYYLGSGYLANAGKIDESMEFLARALRINPEHMGARYLGSKRKISEGDYAGALDYLGPLTERDDLDSLDVVVYFDTGKCYYHLEEFDKAENFTKRAISIDSTLAMAYNQLGLIYDSRKQYLKAIDHYHKTLELDPGFFKAHSNLGVSYFKRGEFKQARNEFNFYLSKTEDPEEIAKLKVVLAQLDKAINAGD